MSDLLTFDEARSRVTKGAALLDREWPGWAREIQVGKLDLANECFCILGQLEGDFYPAAKRFFPHLRFVDTANAAAVYGFHCGVEEANGMWFCRRTDDYKPLQDAWIEAIADRLVQSSEVIASEVSA